MATANIDVSLVLAALAVGIAVPVLVQAFVTLRTVNRVILSLDRRLEATLSDLSRVAGRIGPVSEQNQFASILGAAVVPAIAAAVRSLRHPDPHGTEDQGAKGANAESASPTR